jgi:hypothetical protein
MRFRAIALASIVIGAFVLIGGSPSNAQQPATMTGDWECVEEGNVRVIWTILNLAGAPGEVTSAELSGVASGDISFDPGPNPFTGDDERIVATFLISPDVVGVLTLDVTVTFDFKDPLEVELSASTELNGSCEPPPPESTSTTSSSVQAAAATRPSFTG